MDFLTKLCLMGAAVLFAALAVAAIAQRLVRAMRAQHASKVAVAVFLAFLGVATDYAQKLRSGGGSAPAPVPLFSSASVTTNGMWDFSPPPGAIVHERWRRRGAADDWFPLSPAGWSFALGDTSVTNLRVFSRGKSRLPGGAEVSPLPATLGIVPEANWQLLGSNSPSLFWHSLSSDGSLLLTWHNVLLHRAATNPVSVQAELRPSGGITFRYDRLESVKWKV